jgi:hypothetical protein
MALRADEFMRVAEMLKSIEPDLDYPNDPHSTQSPGFACCDRQY